MTQVAGLRFLSHCMGDWGQQLQLYWHTGSPAASCLCDLEYVCPIILCLVAVNIYRS